MKRVKVLLTLFVFFLSYHFLHGQNYTLSGYVKDNSTGEILIGATVYDQVSKKGTATNSFGFYSLTLPSDSVKVIASFVGFQVHVERLLLNKDLLLNISLTSSNALDEVVVSAEGSRRIEQSTQMSAVSIPIEQIRSLPAFFGEVDLLKVIQLMPGVQAGAEGTTGFYVRGGSPDQNLILLDGVPLYHVSHLGGLFSIFNADAISNVSLIKGGYPARYGGRLSSVLDIRMKEGNMKEFHGQGSLSFIAPKLSLEGPIIKDRTSFIVSARRTFADLFLKPISKASSDNKTSFGYYFYDFNAKINHIVSNRDRVYLSFYSGDDRYSANLKSDYYRTDSIPVVEIDTLNKNKGKIRVGWGNVLSSLRWNHIYNDKLFSNATINYTKYRLIVKAHQESSLSLNNEVFKETQTDFISRSGIEDLSAKIDYEFYPNPSHSFKFGGNVIYHTFTPGISTFKENSNNELIDTTFSNYKLNAWEGSLYVEDDWEISKVIKLNLGLHYSGFFVNNKFYKSLQPRVAGRFLVGDNLSIKASYSTMQQFLHLLTNSNAGLPTDLWVPVTDKVTPQTSQQFAAGLAKSIRNNTYEFSLEGYYKEMGGLIEYKEGTNFLTSSDNWEESIESEGKGLAMGIELLLQRKTGKLTGWIGYTLSKTERKFDNINFGKWYPFKYDRRHDFSIVCNYKISKKVSLSGSWVHGTGNAVTLPVVQYHQDRTNAKDNFAKTIHVYNGRNSFRMRSYHRLDFNISFSKVKRWGERSWNFGAYNLYSRKNPYLYFIDGNPYFTRTVKQVSLFPIIPYFSYNFKF